MDSVSSAYWAILAGSTLITIWFIATVFFAGSRKWMFFKKRLGCFFGKHTPNTPEAVIGGRQVQRCLYCDVVVKEYRVSLDSVRREK